MEEKITIIVPVYNVELYLERCVDSILAQSHRNLEVILVDDGSPDNSGAICDAYAAKDPRVSVIHKPNGGLSDARNAGLEVATGEIVGFCDSDDFMHPDMVRELHAMMTAHDADIAQCSIRSVTDSTMPDPGDDPAVRVMTGLETLGRLYTTYVMDYVLANNKLYRRSLFDGIRYPLGKIHEDEFTTWKLFHKARRVAVTERKYFYYFQSPGSITRGKFNAKKLHYAEALEERIEGFGRAGLHELRYTALRRYAGWLILFTYRNREDLREHPDVMKDLQNRFEAVAKQLADEPHTGACMRRRLRRMKVDSFLGGFFVYHHLYKQDSIGKAAGLLGLNF